MCLPFLFTPRKMQVWSFGLLCFSLQSSLSNWKLLLSLSKHSSLTTQFPPHPWLPWDSLSCYLFTEKEEGEEASYGPLILALSLRSLSSSCLRRDCLLTCAVQARTTETKSKIGWKFGFQSLFLLLLFLFRNREEREEREKGRERDFWSHKPCLKRLQVVTQVQRWKQIQLKVKQSGFRLSLNSNLKIFIA